ncbi:MAG: outer membrane protein assembly factor BamA [Fidelibacterota bacterium]
MKGGSVLPVLLAAAVTMAGAQSDGSIRLLQVNLEGNEMTSPRVIKYTSGLVEGKTIVPGDLSRSVKKLWDTGLFSDIQIRLDRETPEGIEITIQVEENPILEEVRFEGGKNKRRELEEELGLTTGQRIRPHLLKEAEEKIRKLYEEDGYLKAEVTSELQEGSSPYGKVLTFRIDERKKVKIREIQFTGNEAFSDGKLRRQLRETKRQRWYLFWRSSFDREEYEQDKTLLTSFYRNHGYKDFRILSDSIAYSDDGKGMVITFDLYEGRPYYLREFSWEGNTLYPDSRLQRALGLKKGDLYDEEEFNKAVFEQVLNLYMDNGYIYSNIDPQVRPVGDDSLDIHFVVTENHQVSVRKIEIAGNTKTRENVIRRELKILPGDIFNRDLLMRSMREIFILNYFADVRPDVIPVADDEVDLEITVEEKSSDQANASIGFTGEYGITGGAGVQFNNFRGMGQQLAFSFQQGTQYSVYTRERASRYRSVSLSFTDPMVKDTPNLVGLSAFYYLRGASAIYSYSVDRESIGGSVRWGRRLKWPDNFFRASWMLRGSRTTYRGSEENLSLLTEGLTQTVGLSITQGVSRDSRNHPEFPSMGSSFQWTSTLSGGPLSGPWLRVNESFHKHVLKFDWFTPGFWKTALMSSLQLGAIKKLPFGIDQPAIVPLQDRFIMGGSGIPYGILLRGYRDNTVGPINNDLRPIGGNVMLKYMVEFRVPFSENPTVYGLVFAEMGNVWRDFSETDPFDLKRSAGAGVRMFMPMLGMLGFDLGYGFDDVPATEASPEGWNFHVLFGMPF